MIQLRQVVEAVGGIWVLRPQRFLSDGQSSLGKGLSLGIKALRSIELSQVIEALGSIWMFRPQRFLSDGQGPLNEGFGLRVETLVKIQLSQVVEAGGGIWLFRPQIYFLPRQASFCNSCRLCILAGFIKPFNLYIELLYLLGIQPRIYLRCGLRNPRISSSNPQRRQR